MEIRALKPDNLEHILNKIHFKTPFVGSIREIKEKFISSNNIYPFGIFLDNEPVGFFTISLVDHGIEFKKNSKGNCWVGSFFIAEKYQGKGLAKESLKIIPGYLKERFPFLDHISLTVNIKNKTALNLYKKTGFCDTQMKYLGGPAGPQHILTKKI